MNRFLMFFMSLGFLCPSLSAQPLAIQHRSETSPGGAYSNSHDLTRSPSGDLYLAGEFKGRMAMPDSTYTSHGIAGLQTPDGFISKYSASGRYEWTIQIRSEIYGQVNQVHFQPGVGCWALINSMNGTILDSLTISHPGDFIDVLALFSEDGELLFSETITGSQGISDLHVCIGENDDIFLNGTVEGDLQIGGFSLSNTGSPLVGFLVRMKKNGAMTWEADWGQKIGNQNVYWGHPSAGPDGEVYITGQISADGVIPAVFGAQTITHETVWDLFVARFDSTGTLEWLHTSPDASQNVSPSARGRAIQHDGNGHVYVTGEFGGASLDFGSSSLTNVQTGKDFFLAKFADSGTLQWAINNGGMTQAARGSELAMGDQGEVFVQGTYGVGTQGGHEMELGSGTNKVTLPVTADEDVFQAAFSASGDLLWAESNNGYSDDFSGGIVAIGNGQAAWSGGFSDTLLLPDTMLVATPDLISTNAFLTWSGQGGANSITSETFAHWTISPNPNNGQFITRTETRNPDVIWTLRDLRGKVLVQQSSEPTDIHWNLSDLPAGLYVLSCTDGLSISAKKVLIQRN